MLNINTFCFRAKDLKSREFFEKQFPELKKQREDKERISRVSQRIRSDAEWEEIIDGLQEQEVSYFPFKNKFNYMSKQTLTFSRLKIIKTMI